MKIVEGKKLSPSGATQIPLLHRPRGPSLPSLRTLPWPSPPEPVDQGWPGYPSLQEQWLPPSYLMMIDLVIEARIEDTSSVGDLVQDVVVLGW